MDRFNENLTKQQKVQNSIKTLPTIDKSDDEQGTPRNC